MEKNYKIVKYTDEYENIWDEFVMKNSVNGTFLQSRKFYNYHPKGRFQDCSCLIFNKKDKIAAVCPACEVFEEEKVFVSHRGSTFGGLILAQKEYSTEKVLDMIDEFEAHLKEEGFSKVVLKQTSDIFSSQTSELLQYCFYYKNYSVKNELSCYIDLCKIDNDILKNFSHGKRYSIKKCEKNHLSFRQLTTREDAEAFHQVLCDNLKKYDAKPVHTLDEIWEFMTVRFKGGCELYGVYSEDGKLISGAMTFLFEQTQTVHTQYLCALEEYNHLSPMAYLCYKVLEEIKNRGFKKLSWGKSTEDEGRYINIGLIRQKESFGSLYSLNQIFEKKLT